MTLIKGWSSLAWEYALALAMMWTRSTTGVQLNNEIKLQGSMHVSPHVHAAFDNLYNGSKVAIAW